MIKIGKHQISESDLYRRIVDKIPKDQFAAIIRSIGKDLRKVLRPPKRYYLVKFTCIQGEQDYRQECVITVIGKQRIDKAVHEKMLDFWGEPGPTEFTKLNHYDWGLDGRAIDSISCDLITEDEYAVLKKFNLD